MNSNIEFSSSDMFLFAGITLVVIFAVIFAVRFWLSKANKSDLKTKYKNWKWSSPLKGRNKYPEVNVFRYSDSFLLFGFLISLGLCFVAFNWTSHDKVIYIPADALVLEEDIEVEPPRSDVKPPPPPPPPPPVIQEVPEEVYEEEDEVEFLDQSIDENTEVAESFVPEPTREDPKVAPPPPPPLPEPEVEEIFQVVEEMPRFPGCEDITDKAERKQCADQKMLDFIYSNIEYPNIARENGVSGIVVIRFYVDEKGMIKKANIIKDVGAGCGAEALRVINLMNEEGKYWIPGMQRGRPVKVWFNLPVKFKLV